MGRSIKSRLIALFVVAVASFGIFAGAAFASNHGYSGGAATHSCLSTGGGIANAAFNTPAGDASASFTTTNFYYPPYVVGYAYSCE
jgi:hypothetical protein